MPPEPSKLSESVAKRKSTTEDVAEMLRNERDTAIAERNAAQAECARLEGQVKDLQDAKDRESLSAAEKFNKLHEEYTNALATVQQREEFMDRIMARTEGDIMEYKRLKQA